MGECLITRRGGAGAVLGGGVSLAYTGSYDDYGVVTMTDGDYRLVRFTSSGTLTFDAEQVRAGVEVDLCMVGGGAGGRGGAGSTQGGSGGGRKRARGGRKIG